MYKLAVFALGLTASSLLVAQNKMDERLQESATVLQTVLTEGHTTLPVPVLQESRCIAIFPSVKKVAIGFGGSYGRGVLVCRKGANMKGAWGAPAMYALDQGSFGAQFGSNATDIVLAILTDAAANKIIEGGNKLGSSASVAAGPTGAMTCAFSPQADVLTYTRSRGVFAGVALSGVSLDSDNDANKKVYGKEMSARDIVTSDMEIVPAARPLVDLLNKTSPAGNTY